MAAQGHGIPLGKHLHKARTHFAVVHPHDCVTVAPQAGMGRTDAAYPLRLLCQINMAKGTLTENFMWMSVLLPTFIISEGCFRTAEPRNDDRPSLPLFAFNFTLTGNRDYNGGTLQGSPKIKYQMRRDRGMKMKRNIGWKSVLVAVAMMGAGVTGPAQAQESVSLQASSVQKERIAESAATIDYGILPESRSTAQWIAAARKFACSTYSLTTSTTPNGKPQSERLIYDPAKIWAAEADGKATGPKYLTDTATDSAAAATALATGQKTYNAAINEGNDSTDSQKVRLQSLPELAKQEGKITGVVTTVPISHATPAGLGGAHNANRNNYAEIANEMFESGTLDLIFGAGHPWFDDDGRSLIHDRSGLPIDPPTNKSNYQYVGGEETWQKLKDGTHPGSWKLIDVREDFTNLANGATGPDMKYDGAKRLVGVAQVASTLQQGRGGAKGVQTDAEIPAPFSGRMNENVPTEASMTHGALNFLHNRSKESGDPGFWLMIEGGAIDWAAHANQKTRLIEETRGHQRTVFFVLQWLRDHKLLDRTLVIATADHETGLIWGPESDRFAFDPIRDIDGDGKPDFRFNAGGHSNSLVPLWVWGGDERLFEGLTIHEDPAMGPLYGDDCANYLDNTDVFRLSERAILDPSLGIDNVIILIGDGMGFNTLGATNSVRQK